MRGVDGVAEETTRGEGIRRGGVTENVTQSWIKMTQQWITMSG